MDYNIVFRPKYQPIKPKFDILSWAFALLDYSPEIIAVYPCIKDESIHPAVKFHLIDYSDKYYFFGQIISISHYIEDADQGLFSFEYSLEDQYGNIKVFLESELFVLTIP